MVTKAHVLFPYVYFCVTFGFGFHGCPLVGEVYCSELVFASGVQRHMETLIVWDDGSSYSKYFEGRKLHISIFGSSLYIFCNFAAWENPENFLRMKIYGALNIFGKSLKINSSSHSSPKLKVKEDTL